MPEEVWRKSKDSDLGIITYSQETISNKGEDVSLVMPEKGVIGVFDGVGSTANAAEVASRAAAEVKDYLSNISESVFSKLDPQAAVEKLLTNALTSARMNIEEIKDGSTTAVIGKVWKDQVGKRRLSVAHFGDSRMYVMRQLPSGELKLKCLTIDNAPIFIKSDKQFKQAFRETSGINKTDDEIDEIVKSINEDFKTRLSEGVSEKRLQIEKQELLAKNSISDLRRDHNLKGICFYCVRNIIDTDLKTGTVPRLNTIYLDDSEKGAAIGIVAMTDGVHDNLTDAEILQVLMANPNRLTNVAFDKSQMPDGKIDDITAVYLQLSDMSDKAFIATPSEGRIRE